VVLLSGSRLIVTAGEGARERVARVVRTSVVVVATSAGIRAAAASVGDGAAFCVSARRLWAVVARRLAPFAQTRAALHLHDRLPVVATVSQEVVVTPGDVTTWVANPLLTLPADAHSAVTAGSVACGWVLAVAVATTIVRAGVAVIARSGVLTAAV